MITIYQPVCVVLGYTFLGPNLTLREFIILVGEARLVNQQQQYGGAVLRGLIVCFGEYWGGALAPGFPCIERIR